MKIITDHQVSNNDAHVPSNCTFDYALYQLTMTITKQPGIHGVGFSDGSVFEEFFEALREEVPNAYFIDGWFLDHVGYSVDALFDVTPRNASAVVIPEAGLEYMGDFKIKNKDSRAAKLIAELSRRCKRHNLSLVGCLALPADLWQERCSSFTRIETQENGNLKVSFVSHFEEPWVQVHQQHCGDCVFKPALRSVG